MKYNELMMEMQLPVGCNLIKRNLNDKEKISTLLKNASGFFGETFWAYIDLSGEKYSKERFDFSYMYKYLKTDFEENYIYKTRWLNGEAFRQLIDCDILLQLLDKYGKKTWVKKHIVKKHDDVCKLIEEKPHKNRLKGISLPTSFLTDCFETSLVKETKSAVGIVKLNVNFDNADELSEDQQISLLPFLDIRSSVKGNVVHSGNWTQFRDLNDNLYENIHDYHDIEFDEKKD